MEGFNHYVPPTTKIPFQSDKRFHVFLSFRGEDVRKTFVDHLYEALSSAGLRVFLDTYELEKGDIIDPTLKAAIKSSAICIPIFSKGYASSAWCLREVACMLDPPGLIIPLFYDVEPTHVRFPQSHSSPYAPYFASHYEKGRYEREEIEKWKQSLHEICARSGWSKELTGGYEGQLVKRVTLDVMNSLDKVPLDVATHPVGLEDRKQDLIQRLNLDSVNDQIKLGILGIGGIGKTTLVKAVYNEVYRQFDRSSFLSNVRSTAEKASGLEELQRKILKDLAEYDVEVCSVDEGKALMRDHLGGVRALLVLDDVNDHKQLKSLLGHRMAPGSRVLVTSRDRHILNLLNPPEISNQFIYEVSALKENEALQLFRWHAFLKSSPNQQYESLSNRIVEACKGHPLSLEVTGAFLYDKKSENDIECWNETLLDIGSQEEIFKTLYISYRALSHEEKEIFLDTACFFKGEKMTHHVVFWQYLGFKKVRIAISNLSMKLLLKIDDEGVFDMHDHLQEMGKMIVKREFSGDAYHERSRVWETEHACNLFNNNLSNQNVKMSRLRLQGGYLPYNEVWNTPNLRLLHMKNTKMKPGTVKLHPNLIWLRLESCPLASEEDGLYKQKRKRNSSVSPKWGPRFSFDGHDWQLRIMELRKCRELQRLPSSIGNLSKLQSLKVSKCKELKNLPDSLGKLSQLESLEVSWCHGLENLPKTICNLSQLKSLDLSYCHRLENLPKTIGNLSQLKSLDLSDCIKLENLPDAFGNLTQLRSLNLSYCQRIENLPDTLGKLTHLEDLDLNGCESLKNLPDAVGNLTQLRSLNLNQCWLIENLPDTLGKLTHLEHLDLDDCDGLKNLPDAFGNLTQLRSLNLGDCWLIENLPDTLGKLTHLEHLDLNGCNSLKNLPHAFGNLTQLRSLNLSIWI